jgi:predicted tellurium resistance membrane protein TerC
VTTLIEWLANPQTWIGLVTLTALEIVLGVDNVIFVSILASKLREAQRSRARRVGLFLAMFMRIGLLFSLAWMIRLTEPLFTVLGRGFAGRDVILIGGGLFLIAKSTFEIHDKLEGEEGEGSARIAPSFSAVGMANDLGVMVAAVVLAVAVMMVSADAISGFVDRHPTVKILALSFLLLIGVSLVADGFQHHIPKGYIYFAMAFSVCVEMINLRLHARTRPVELRHHYLEEVKDRGEQT